MTSDLANNGKEAVDMLRTGARYDVVLMDVQMPVMDGLDATREIRRMERSGEIEGRNFVVATSANATAENHQRGFAAGMDEYITKPIYPTRLKELPHASGKCARRRRRRRRRRERRRKRAR